jgi:mannose-6-phosphate isomerase-like protein (cupin superfamily)
MVTDALPCGRSSAIFKKIAQGALKADGTINKPLLEKNVAENPAGGERFVFTTSGRDNGGAFVRFDFFTAPTGGVPLVHRHIKQEEVFRCVRGKLTMNVDGKATILEPGMEVSIPKGVPHSFTNPYDEECFCVVDYRPAGRNEDWFKVLGAMVKLTGKEPGLLDLAPFILDVDIYISGPPIWVQKALFMVLRPVSIALGRKKKLLAMASEVYGRPFTW